MDSLCAIPLYMYSEIERMWCTETRKRNKTKLCNCGYRRCCENVTIWIKVSVVSNGNRRMGRKEESTIITVHLMGLVLMIFFTSLFCLSPVACLSFTTNLITWKNASFGIPFHSESIALKRDKKYFSFFFNFYKTKKRKKLMTYHSLIPLPTFFSYQQLITTKRKKKRGHEKIQWIGMDFSSLSLTHHSGINVPSVFNLIFIFRAS